MLRYVALASCDRLAEAFIIWQRTGNVKFQPSDRNMSTRTYCNILRAFVHSVAMFYDLSGAVGLRWLETVSSTYILIDRYNHSLSLNATMMVSKNFPTIGEHFVTIFVTQKLTTVLFAKNTL